MNNCGAFPRGILVVDDHGPVLAVLRDLLELAFPERALHTATNAAEAIALCRSERPGVVVMDLILPDKNGIEAMREIVAECASVQVVMHSSHDDPAIREASIAGGAAAFIPKGHSPELVAIVSELLRTPDSAADRPPAA